MTSGSLKGHLATSKASIKLSLVPSHEPLAKNHPSRHYVGQITPPHGSHLPVPGLHLLHPRHELLLPPGPVPGSARGCRGLS